MNNLVPILQIGHNTCEKNFNNLSTIFLCNNLAAIFLCNNLGTIFLEVLGRRLAANDNIKTKNNKNYTPTARFSLGLTILQDC